jgi:hypothetical protein
MRMECFLETQSKKQTHSLLCVFAFGRGAGGSAKSCDALLVRVERNDPTLEELVVLPNKIFGAAQVERLSNALGR